MTRPLEDLRTFIAHRVREGFESAHEIVENATDKFGEDFKSDVKRFTAELLAAHQAEQAEWGPSTDCDRIDEAFAALNLKGIVARQDFSCCNNCGFTEIWDEVEEAEKTQTIEGYVFYHFQCTEHAIKTGQLMMAYGCVEEDPEAFQRVGNAVVAELRRVGLDASWVGTAGHPIVVNDIVWHRRR